MHGGLTVYLEALEMAPERLINDLRNGQAIQICLAPNRLNPAAFDMEGDALGLLGGIAGLSEGGFPTLPPGNHFLEVSHHVLKHAIGNSGCIRGGSLGTFLAGCSHGDASRARVYTRCTPTYTEV